MADDTYLKLAEMILIAHQRRSDGNCLCGRLEIGDSWALHVAQLLEVSGALKRTSNEF